MATASFQGRGREAFFGEEPVPSSLTIEMTPELLEYLRRQVKGKGADVVFVRMSSEEKLALSDIVHHYRHRGVRTSENEIGRIALALAIQDHAQNGEQSALARILSALRS